MHISPPGLRKGAWTEEEDILLKKYVEKYGEGKWYRIPYMAGLNRCRKSCRLRWLNYLNPNIKRGNFSSDEVDLMVRLHKLLGNRWSLIAGRLPGRTANDIKNYWNSHIQKKLGVDETGEASTRRCSKSKAEQTTASNLLFKPRPWKFSKNAPCLRENLQVNARTNYPTISTDSAPKLVSIADHDKQSFELGNILNDKEMSDEPTRTFSGTREDSRTAARLWFNEPWLGALEGGNYTQDDLNGFGDFCIDSNLSDLLLSGP